MLSIHIAPPEKRGGKRGGRGEESLLAELQSPRRIFRYHTRVPPSYPTDLLRDYAPSSLRAEAIQFVNYACL